MKRYIRASHEEDYEYGFDSNGEQIDESTVDELRRIVTYDVLPFTELDQLGNCYLDEDSFEHTATGTAFGAYLQYQINLSTTDDEIDVYSFQRNHNEMMVDFNDDRNYVNFDFAIKVDGDKIDVSIEDLSVYDNGIYSDFFTEKFQKCFDIDGICQTIKEIAEPAVRDIHAAVSNI